MWKAFYHTESAEVAEKNGASTSRAAVPCRRWVARRDCARNSRFAAIHHADATGRGRGVLLDRNRRRAWGNDRAPGVHGGASARRGVGPVAGGGIAAVGKALPQSGDRFGGHSGIGHRQNCRRKTGARLRELTVLHYFADLASPVRQRRDHRRN